MSDLRILLVGKICGGDTEWRIAPLPVEEAPDGELQAVIDYGQELQELQDDMEDRLWHSRGGW